MKRKRISILLCVILASVVFPAPAYAEIGNDFSVTGGIQGVDYTYSTDGVLSFSTPGAFEVTMTNAGSSTTTDKIVVSGGTSDDPVHIMLNDVSIDQAGCAFMLQGSSVVRLTLSGSNHLTSGGFNSGLQVAESTVLSIDGAGSLDATGTSQGAGIGIGYGTGDSGGTVSINGGTITATGGTVEGAGIEGHEVYINGGSVAAYGGTWSPGIGCSPSQPNCSLISITGGTVDAVGGGDGATIYGAGAGIGCSCELDWIPSTCGRVDTISISGGIITATGGSVTGIVAGSGAGIGGGNETDGGIIIISGGTIDASCGNSSFNHYGAGIGGGAYAGGGTITISGGTVTAAGKSGSSADIGSGYNPPPGLSDSCIISGGSVNASSVNPAPYCDSGKTAEAYVTAVTLENVTQKTQITSLRAGLNESDYSYGIYDIRTDTNGTLYLWLPDETNTIEAATAQNLYRGTVTTASNPAISLGTLYTVPVHTITATTGSGGNISPGGAVSVTEGENQTFTITPDSNYRISSVAVDSMDVGAVSTYTFSNVASGHTIHAAFAYSGGSSGNSENNSSQKETEQNINISSSDGKITIHSTISGDGSIYASLTKALISEALNKAIRKAVEDSAPDIVLEIVINGPDTATGVTLSLPAEILDLLTDSEISLLRIITPNGAFAFDADTLKLFQRQADGDFSVSVTAVDPQTLSSEARKVIGSRPVYDFRVEIGKTFISDFGGGTATVSLPYTPAGGEDTEQIVIYYISDHGDLVMVPNCDYDAASGTITFITTHFSTFAVGYNQISFADVSGWYEDSVQYLAARGVINGTEEGGGGSPDSGKFSPDSNLTRAQLVTILANLSGDDMNLYSDSSFADVTASKWYGAAVQWAYQNGIVTGFNGSFHPNSPVSRQDIAVILTRYSDQIAKCDLPETHDRIFFTDSNRISSYAADAVTSMQRAGIIAGNSDGSFVPDANATRAQAAKMIAEFLKGTV